MKKFELLIVILFFNYTFSFAQNFTFIAGKVINKDTQQPVEGVFVGIPAKGALTSSLGVVTNELGEFTLKYPILLQNTGNFVITKVDFKDIRKSLIEYKVKRDSLVFEIQPVPQKTIEANDGRKVLDYAISRLEKNYNGNPYFMNGFYREVLTWDSSVVKLSEAVVKVEKYPFPEKGNLGEVSKLLKGRTYLKDEQRESWENLQFGNGVDLVSRTIESKLPDFLEKQNLKNYKFQINTNLSEYDGMPVYNISFSPIDKKVKGGKVGEIQVDTITMGIINYSYQFTPEGLKDVMGGSAFGGSKDATVKSFKVRQAYHAASNNYYLHDSVIEIEAESVQNKQTTYAYLLVKFNPTETNTRMGLPIKDNEIMENTDFPNGGKKYEDNFWGNFNFIKPNPAFRQIVK
ncbi:MAG: carboxypeptidase-like regulatory domain-containing protein [Arcicella sp.]|nr:carboxypeptidase-like regulatory domain-containing protein [Arcicella sp.]